MPALRDVISRYAEGDDELRAALRALLEPYRSFRWAATLPFEPTPEGFRQRLLEMSVKDHDVDRYGMGSMRGILRRAAGREPVGLW